MNLSRAATAWIDRLVDAGIVAFAAWTVAYHVCFVLELGVWWAWGLTVVAGVGFVVLHRRLPGEARSSEPVADHGEPGARRREAHSWRREWTAYVTVAAALVAGLGIGLRWSWSIVWPCWLIAAAAATVTAWRWLSRPAVQPAAGDEWEPIERWAPLIALAWALAMAVVSVWSMGVSSDDLYYVNLSQWVSDHGVFPHRDTLFANLTYPMSNWPPAASYDPLVGALARLVSAKAASVEYYLVVPIVTFVAVLAVWRLLRAWRVRPAIVALSVGLLAVLVGAHPAFRIPGDGLVGRIWEGKFILAWVVIPWLLVHLVDYFDRPGRRQLLYLFAGGAAAVGCSTTGIFVVPVVAVAAAVPLLRTSWRRAVACFLATSAYPLGTGVVTKLVGGRDADLFTTHGLGRFNPEGIARVFFPGSVLAIGVVLAVLLGALVIPHRGARVTSAILTIAVGVVFIPGFTHFSYDVIGLGPTIRRIQKGLVFIALIGALVVWAGALARRSRWRWLSIMAAAVAATVFFAQYGSPVRSGALTTWQRPFHWQIEDADRAVADRIIRDEPIRGLVLAPPRISVAIAVTSTTVKTVSPAAYYLEYLKDDPTIHYNERIELLRFVSTPAAWTPRGQPMLEHALAEVPVAVACVRADAAALGRALRAAGFMHYFRTPDYRCYRRTPV